MRCGPTKQPHTQAHLRCNKPLARHNYLRVSMHILGLCPMLTRSARLLVSAYGQKSPPTNFRACNMHLSTVKRCGFCGGMEKSHRGKSDWVWRRAQRSFHACLAWPVVQRIKEGVCLAVSFARQLACVTHTHTRGEAVSVGTVRNTRESTHASLAHAHCGLAVQHESLSIRGPCESRPLYAVITT